MVEAPGGVGLVPLRVLKSKMTAVRGIPVPFRVLSWIKYITGTSFVLELVPLK